MPERKRFSYSASEVFGNHDDGFDDDIVTEEAPEELPDNGYFEQRSRREREFDEAAARRAERLRQYTMKRECENEYRRRYGEPRNDYRRQFAYYEPEADTETVPDFDPDDDFMQEPASAPVGDGDLMNETVPAPAADTAAAPQDNIQDSGVQDSPTPTSAESPDTDEPQFDDTGFDDLEPEPSPYNAWDSIEDPAPPMREDRRGSMVWIIILLLALACAAALLLIPGVADRLFSRSDDTGNTFEEQYDAVSPSTMIVQRFSI